MLQPTMDRPLVNTYWILPQRMLAGEYPGRHNADETQVRLKRLHAAGINSFIDLTEEGELPPYRQLLSPDSEYRRFSIADCGVPNNVIDTRAALGAISDALSRGRRIYVHCRAGIGRTGLIVGCFLAERESNAKAGLKLLNRLWAQNERAASWPRVPQTEEQADYVRQWLKLSRRPTPRARFGFAADRR
jgi:hypothetical protein